jgi:cytoskeleton protein RodZ
MDDFGGKLRQARERRGISLRQIAASTKISAAALEALERNDISKLPGGIFSRAFVKSYAVEVGLDPDKTVEEFLARFNQEAPPTAESVVSSVPEAEIEFESRQRTAGRLLTIALIAIPVLALLGYFAWKGRVAARQQDMLPAVTPITAPKPLPPPAPDPVPDTGAASSAPRVK